MRAKLVLLTAACFIPFGLSAEETYYGVVIKPIFEERCNSCHGEEKQKGDVALHTKKAILNGIDGDDILSRNDPAASILAEVLRLPLDDDYHMPPENKTQLTERQIEAIEWWVNSGSSFKTPLSETPNRFRTMKTPSDPPIRRQSIYSGFPEPDLSAVRALRAKRVFVQRIEEGSNALLVDFTAEALKTDDAWLADLKSISANIVWLNLARTKIGNDALKVAIDI